MVHVLFLVCSCIFLSWIPTPTPCADSKHIDIFDQTERLINSLLACDNIQIEWTLKLLNAKKEVVSGKKVYSVQKHKYTMTDNICRHDVLYLNKDGHRLEKKSDLYDGQNTYSMDSFDDDWKKVENGMMHSIPTPLVECFAWLDKLPYNKPKHFNYDSDKNPTVALGKDRLRLLLANLKTTKDLIKKSDPGDFVKISTSNGSTSLSYRGDNVIPGFDTPTKAFFEFSIKKDEVLPVEIGYIVQGNSMMLSHKYYHSGTLFIKGLNLHIPKTYTLQFGDQANHGPDESENCYIVKTLDKISINDETINDTDLKKKPSMKEFNNHLRGTWDYRKPLNLPKND